VPFGGWSWNSTVSAKPDDDNSPIDAGMFLGTADFLKTTGLKLIAGRDFTPEEHVADDALTNDRIPSTILTRALAERVFPGQNAIGKQIYMGKAPITVVGEVETLMRDAATPVDASYAMIVPVNPTFGSNGTLYLLRVDPARRDEVIAAIEPTIRKINSHRLVLKKEPFTVTRDHHFRNDRSMVYLLIGVTVALLVITALGIVGLASFWVQQRTRQIGVRRALGATRQDIVRYFQVENFILATVGIVAGMALAYGLNLWLIRAYQVPRLPAQFLPVGALLLWLLGQIAVLGPALRAARISPAIATRSV
jgi:putative ABC transport system permease protein